MSNEYGLWGNIVIKGIIKAKSGLHIGSSAETVEIGGIDSPVIKDPISGAPYIPGSSLKGKMRSFMEKLEKTYQGNNFQFNRKLSSDGNLKIHACADTNFSYSLNMTGPGAAKCPVCRVYGSTGEKKDFKNQPSRIIVRDCMLTNKDYMMDDNLFIFEAKMENAIDRMTAQAQPRTFERVPAGAEFGFEIVFKVQGQIKQGDNGQSILDDVDYGYLQRDLQNIFIVLHLIQLDGIGGSISRGYGNVDILLNLPECLYYPIGEKAKNYLPTIPENKDTLDYLRTFEFKEINKIVTGVIV